MNQEREDLEWPKVYGTDERTVRRQCLSLEMVWDGDGEADYRV